MKFIKTVNLWDEQVQKDLQSGKLVLKAGQWVQCGQGHKARFVGVKPSGSIWVAHYQGTPYSVNRKFSDMNKAFKGVKP